MYANSSRISPKICLEFKQLLTSVSHQFAWNILSLSLPNIRYNFTNPIGKNLFKVDKITLEQLVLISSL